ncbi:MAG: hypothetical protein NUW07_04325 [Candidatus Saccharicenans sp.]|jgi:hypothetical protein|nr:hypothetical protein [Candidatus Saccharicenans sp.]MDH7493036.1 hypothetical protein [Candidatus Saccharicenans sp.]
MTIEKEKAPVTHLVELIFTPDHQLKCDPASLVVNLGDRIIWKWRGGEDFPFGIVIKSPFMPLQKPYYLTRLEPKIPKAIETGVLSCAPAGHYHYLVAAYVHDQILVEDPEIIIRPPDGRGPGG